MTIDDGAPAGPDPWAQAPAGESSPATPPVVEEPVVDERPRKARKPWPLGYVAFGIAVLLVIAEGVAVYLGSFGEPAVATIIGQVLVVVTAFPFALGLLAAIRNRKREWGIAAMVLAVIANPFILINVLGFFGAF